MTASRSFLMLVSSGVLCKTFLSLNQLPLPHYPPQKLPIELKLKFSQQIQVLLLKWLSPPCRGKQAMRNPKWGTILSFLDLRSRIQPQLYQIVKKKKNLQLMSVRGILRSGQKPNKVSMLTGKRNNLMLTCGKDKTMATGKLAMKSLSLSS